MESSSPSSGPTSSPSSTSNTDREKPQPLSAIAQQAYDRYGILDPIKLDLMIRGIFITREDAAALPHSITPDGCAEAKTGGSHYQRTSMSQTAPRLAPVALPTVARTSPVARPAPVTRASSVVSSSARTDISAIPSNHEKWPEEETKLLIKMRAERIGFRYIADRFPGKNQKAVQEKFYKAIKDTREPRWKRLYEDLRARHDDIMVPCAGTVESPIEISDEDTVLQHPQNSSETLSDTTIAEPEDNSVKNIQNTLGNNMKDIETSIEDVMTTV